MRSYQLTWRGRPLPLGATPVIMGILNVTPDSFSDGGDFYDPQKAVVHGLEMAAAGAGIIDIGGESTRPGAPAVCPEEQIRRVVPVIKMLANRLDIPLSIDTTSSHVARAALAAGASIINDISALTFDPMMAALAAEQQCPVILMHMRGNPQTMQQQPHYQDVVAEVMSYLRERIAYAVSQGISRHQIVVDPGIGFGKTVAHNLLLLKHIERFSALEAPLLVGTSRKSFIGKLLGMEAEARIFGTAATVAWCVAGGVQILRVHDVGPMAQVAKIIAAIRSV